MGKIFAIILGVLLIIFIVFLGMRLRGDEPFSFGSQETNLNINLAEIKPDEWLPYTNDQIKGLVRINIDTRWENDVLIDDEDEWLLFYHYDLNQERVTSQLGGVIYDAQNRPRGIDSIAIPDQSPAYLVPYRLLPDYHLPKTSSYLGDDDVEYKQIAVHIKGENPRNQEPLADRLMVRGVNRGRYNRFAIFWWANEETGYGAAYAYTPGWFSLNEKDPSAVWDAWESGKYIQELWSWEPRYDRSNLCRREQWQLTDGEYPQFVPRSDHDQFYRGEITFCNGQPPVVPAFPEAQVLAYLQDWKSERLASVDIHNPKSPKVDLNIPHYNEIEVLEISVPKELNNGNPPGELPEVKVDVDFNTTEGWRTMTWTVHMIPPETIKDAVKWRIVAAEDR